MINLVCLQLIFSDDEQVANQQLHIPFLVLTEQHDNILYIN